MVSISNLMNAFSKGSVHEIEITNADYEMEKVKAIVIDTAIQARKIRGKNHTVLCVVFTDEETGKIYSLDYEAE